MQTRADGVAAHGISIGPREDCVLAGEGWAAGSVLGVATLRGFRVDRRIQRAQPALVSSVANRGDDEDVAALRESGYRLRYPDYRAGYGALLRGD